MAKTKPQFKPGDRFFTHYDMKWGTVISEDVTYRDQKHGVTGSPLPDTTWYSVKYDDGSTSSLDDAHGNWDMARMVPPHIAERYGYGTDPMCPICGDIMGEDRFCARQHGQGAPFLDNDERVQVVTHHDVEPRINAAARIYRIA